MTLNVLVSIFIFFPLYAGVGSIALRLIRIIEKPVPEMPRVFSGTHFLLGAGVATYLEFLLSLIGAPLRVSLIALAVLALIGFIVGYKKPKLGLKFSIKTILFWIIPVVILLFFFTRSVSRVMYTWDAIAFWIPKMVALYQDQRVNLPGLTKFNHPEYPLLLPLVGANVFTLMGKPDQVAAKAAIFGFTVSLIVMLGQFLQSRMSKPKALFWLLLLMSLFIFREHVAGEYVGTADILVGTYFAAGAMALLRKRPALAFSFWLLAAWSKSEGQVMVLVSAVMLFLLYKHLRVYLITMAGVFLGPWQLLLKLDHIDTSQYFKFNQIYARPWVAYIVYSIHAFREEFRNIQKWNLLFFFFLSATLTHVRKIVKDKAMFIICLGLLAQLVSYIVIFTITPEEQATFIAASISRLTLHLAPTVLVVTAVLLSGDSNLENVDHE
jgi:hypothetical protein